MVEPPKRRARRSAGPAPLKRRAVEGVAEEEGEDEDEDEEDHEYAHVVSPGAAAAAAAAAAAGSRTGSAAASPSTSPKISAMVSAAGHSVVARPNTSVVSSQPRQASLPHTPGSPVTLSISQAITGSEISPSSVLSTSPDNNASSRDVLGGEFAVEEAMPSSPMSTGAADGPAHDAHPADLDFTLYFAEDAKLDPGAVGDYEEALGPKTISLYFPVPAFITAGSRQPGLVEFLERDDIDLSAAMGDMDDIFSLAARSGVLGQVPSYNMWGMLAKRDGGLINTVQTGTVVIFTLVRSALRAVAKSLLATTDAALEAKLLTSGSLKGLRLSANPSSTEITMAWLSLQSPENVLLLSEMLHLLADTVKAFDVLPVPTRMIIRALGEQMTATGKYFLWKDRKMVAFTKGHEALPKACPLYFPLLSVCAAAV